MKNKKFSKLAILALMIFFVLPSISLAQNLSEQKEAVAAEFINEIGKPMLPAKEIKVALPAGMEVTQVKVTDTSSVDIKGKYTIFPAQPPQHTDVSLENIAFIEPDFETYNSMNSYPSKLVEYVHQTDLAGQAMAVIKLYPVQYVPYAEKLTFHNLIQFIIEGKEGYECGDYLPKDTSIEVIETYKQMIQEMVINPEDVELKVGDNSAQPTGVPPGDYDYVIITQDSWVDDFQPLADWKTKKGIPANIVTTDWIYSEYSGSNQQKIRSFVIDAHDEWGTIYFLLGGDTNVIPYQTKYISGDNIPTDTYYGDYDDDWTCEVYIGRAPVQSTGTWGIETFVDKVLTYEKDPPLSDYGKTAAFFGFDLYTYGSNEGEGCKQGIRNLYFPSGWTYRTEYDSESGTHYTDVLNYLNQGNNLVNHIDHSDTDFMGTGYTNHGQGMDTNDAKSRTNGDRQSIIYTIGCWACDYPDSECIAEGFVRNPNGGGIAFVGNSRYGWYSPYNSDYYSLRYDRYFFRSLFDQNHYKLGECFSDHKNDAYQSDDTYRYVFTELTLLGDPELPIWTEDPNEISDVDYPGSIGGGTQSFTVTVTDGGNPVSGVLVCVQKDDEIYETKTTNSNGEASFTITPVTQGTLDVTVTKHNYLPWEGTATVTEGSLDDGIFLIGFITDFDQNGGYITSNAIFVFYLDMNSLASHIYSSNEDVIVSDDYTGYIGPNFVCGIFSVDVN